MYNNINQVKYWKKTKDSSARVISALATEVSNLKEILANGTKPQANATNNSNVPSGQKENLVIPEWRMKNEGPPCDRDG